MKTVADGQTFSRPLANCSGELVNLNVQEKLDVLHGARAGTETACCKASNRKPLMQVQRRVDGGACADVLRTRNRESDAP